MYTNRIRALIGMTLALLLFVVPTTVQTQTKAKPRRPSSVDSELLRHQREVVRTMMESRKKLDNLLALYESERQRLAVDVEVRKGLYEREIVSKSELEQTERALASAEARVKEVRHWITTDDIAIAEALAREELIKLLPLPTGGYSETAALIRYNGGARWALADSHKVEEFFAERFGRALPISAFGQTAVHDRMKFDHRDAMDVALQPDSVEGRALMGYLRQAGIPFIGVRNRISGSATGAHIHIGKPSLRNGGP